MSIPRLVAFVALAFVPAVFGALFAPGPWYQQLAKPDWTPPGWLFGPVWTLLYLLIGIAGALAYGRSEGPRRRTTFVIYGLQLALNAAWSWLFFGLHRPGTAFVEILILLALVVANIVVFLRITRPAGLLLVPYALWVAFASVLNGSIWLMNT